MGLLNFLFSQNKGKAQKADQPDSQSASEGDISYRDNFIEISSIGFFGQFKTSNSGEWIICWSDNDELNHIGGHRESGHGRYVLYNAIQGKIALHGKLERPNSGNVAGSGSFSIEDWHFGSSLRGTFYVFSAIGNQLIKKKFSANILNSDISNNGCYAICQTASAPSSKDGNLLTAFDVEKNAELFSIHPATGWADSYQFVEETSQFAVVLDKIGIFHYDIQGRFLDSTKYDAARLQCDRFEVVLLAAEEILKEPHLNAQRAQSALDAALRARLLGADKYQSWKAAALKIQGLAHEFLGNNEDALSAFDEVLMINPKIGVKRKADSLRKKLTMP